MYHGLDDSYRPWGMQDDPPTLPASAERVKQFIYACAVFAEEEAVERVKAMAGVATTRRVVGGR